MIYSMTGFGRAERKSEGFTLRVEISSINRKQLEVVPQIPRAYQELEAQVRKWIGQRITRGRISVQVLFDEKREKDSTVILDESKAKALHLSMKSLADKFGISLELQAADFLSIPHMVKYESSQVAIEDFQKVLKESVEDALDELMTMRQNEGTVLYQDVKNRLDLLKTITSNIEKKSPEVLRNYRENLQKKLAELEVSFNEENLLREVVLFTDKSDVTEELTRVKSHFSQFYHYLESDKSSGRSLDFLCQELNREYNTIGSKANNAEIAHYVVAAKTEVEKIREQIQNIE